MKRLLTQDTVMVDAVMRELESLGSEDNRRMHARYGVTSPTFGVPYRELKKLQKQLRCDQGLAEQLWATGNHDARLLATLIADPLRMTQEVADTWAPGCTDDALSEAFCAVMWRVPAAANCAAKWRESDNPWVAVLGWCVTRHLAPALENGACAALIAHIGETIGAKPPRVRHQMNLTLVALGVRGDDALREQALAVAAAMGVVDADDPRGGRTPDAANEIHRATRMTNRP